MMKNISRATIALASLLATTGCTHTAAASTPDQGTWRLKRAGTTDLPTAGPRFSIEWGSDGKSVTGQVACNRWKGHVGASKGRFLVEHASSTRKRCAVGSDALSVVEQTFLRRLGEGAESSREGESWILAFPDGTRWILVPQP